MKRTIFPLFLFLSSAVSFYSQVSPTPVINNEIRDASSVRSRSIELERVKREADKPFGVESGEETAIRFAIIKEDFERIQTLQTSIIKTYKIGKTIDYLKISHLSAELFKKAVNLNENLFFSKVIKIENKSVKNKAKSKTVPELIVLLDKSIGSFISSPIFSNTKLVDSNKSEKARIDLEQIIKLSEMLLTEAKKLS